MRGVYRHWVWLRRRNLRWMGLIVTLGPDFSFFSVGIMHTFFGASGAFLVGWNIHTIVAFFRVLTLYHFPCSIFLVFHPPFITFPQTTYYHSLFFSAAVTSLSGYFNLGHSR